MANADAACRKALPESHRRELDGKEVINGQIEYNADGNEWYLYPVLPEWCDGDDDGREPDSEERKIGDCVVCAFEKAIEIVKAGGVNGQGITDSF